MDRLLYLSPSHPASDEQLPGPALHADRLRHPADVYAIPHAGWLLGSAYAGRLRYVAADAGRVFTGTERLL